MKESYAGLKKILNNGDRKNLLLLVILSIVVSIVEVVSISTILPFISIATDFDSINSNIYYSTAFDYFNFKNEVNFLIAFGLLLISLYLIRTIINYVYIYRLALFSRGKYRDISVQLFNKYLGMRYIQYSKKNSSSLVKSIIQDAQGVTEVLNSSMIMLSEIFVVFFIYIMLLYVDLKATLALSFILLFGILIIKNTVSTRLKVLGELTEKTSRNFYEILNRAFSNYKVIKVQSNNDYMHSLLDQSGKDIAKYRTNYEVLVQLPRLMLEFISFFLVVITVLYLVWVSESSLSNSLPLLSIFGLSIYRFIPSTNRILGSYNQIMYHKKSLDVVYKGILIEKELLGDQLINFSNNIQFKDVVFSYENQQTLLNFDLTINKGDRIAILGESGSGKSTFVDILLGLLKPETGALLVDGAEINNKNLIDWRSKIGYMPQSVYLFDGSVGENIAFGGEYIEKKIDAVLKSVLMYDYLSSKQGQNTLVGEDGVMLSGGQKQRIGLARALYRDPELLILDEATSALDFETEAKIMDEVYKLNKNKILIIVTHRASTIKKCHMIYTLKNGRLHKH